MRVLHYTEELRLAAGGVVRAVLDLTAEIARSGAEVTLATGSAPDADAADTPVATIDPAITPWLRPKHAGPEIDRMVSEADVVHLHQPWDPLCQAFARACRRAGKPYLFSVHGMLDDWSMAGKRLKKRVYLALGGRRMLEGAARLHFTAQAERDQAMKWAPRATPLVVPLLMDLSPYDAPPSGQQAEEHFPALARAEGPRLLFLSRVDPKKGVDLLIRTVAGLHAEGQPAEAFIAGPGDEAYTAGLKRLAAELGVADRVHFLGMVKGDLKWSLYRACDLFVLPTHQENFGIVLIEAMGCGLPTLTTDRVDIWQELEQHGATITNDQSEAVFDGVQALLADLPAAKQAAERGRGGLLRWLDPETIRRQYLDAYELAIAEAGVTR